MFEKIQRLIKKVSEQEYAKASIYYVVANIIGQGIILLSSALFTRMMSKTDYGLASTYSTWVLVLNTFICMNLFISVRTAYIDFRSDYDQYNSSVLLLSILCGTGMAAMIVCITRVGRSDLGLQEVLLACIQSIALNIINFMMAIQSMKNEYKQRAIMMIAPNWMHTLLSVGLMLIFTSDLYMAKIAGNAFGLAAFGALSAAVLFVKAVPKVSLQYWEYALRIAVPSIFNTLSDLILMQCDRLMLTSIIGAEETAEYSIIYNVGSIIVAIYQAINGAWLPWFFREVKEDHREKVKQCQGYYMLIFTVFTCGMMTISPELIKIMSPQDYWTGIQYVAPVVAASYLIFLYAFFSAYLLYRKRTVRIAVNTVIVAGLNIAMNFVLIPHYRAVGAVMATVISYMLLFILHLISIKSEGRQYFAIRKMWLNIVGVSMFGVMFCFVRDTWIFRYGLFIAVLVMVWFFRGKDMMRGFVKEN